MTPTPEDLKQIANFNAIVKAYLKILMLENK